MSRARLYGAVLMAALLLSPLGAMAQSPVGQILGTVHDPSGAVVVGASVLVTNLDTGQEFKTTTNAAGDYLVRDLQPGSYAAIASSPGFAEIARSLTLVAFQNARVDLTLQVGGTSESVTVSAAPPQVDTRSNMLGTLVDNRLITEMPINSRNIIETVNYTPGVGHVSAGNNVNRNQQRVNIQGNRSYSTNVQLDGSSMYYPHRGQGINMPVPDAIEEVQVITSGVSAEYGRGTAVFAAVTKSGGNTFKGSGWEFIRNDALDSRPAFSVSKPKLESHDFGATLGGPIFKNRLFFFGAYQGLRIDQDSRTSAPFTPTQAERNGDFSAGAQVPKDPLTGKPFPNGQISTSRFDPVALKILGMVPQPNLPSGALSFSGPNPITGDGTVTKFDFNSSVNDRLSFRWYWDYKRGTSPFPASPAQSIPGYSPSPNSQVAKSANLSYSRIWTPALVSSTRASFTKWDYTEGASVHTSLADLGATNFVDQYADKRLPTITVNGRFSAAATAIDERIGMNYGLAQDWDWLRGAHAVKWGALLERLSFEHPNSSTSAGTFTFDGSITGNPMADFLLGTPASFTQSSGSKSAGHYYSIGAYGQDVWKPRQRLTLTLGMRWDIYTAWREDQGQGAMFIPGVQSTTFPTAPLGMVYESDPQYTYQTLWKNLAPRLGFAWDVSGDGRTAVRGGYGISYDPLPAEPVIGGQQPFSLGVTVNNPGPLSNPYKNTTNPFPYAVNAGTAKFNLPLKLGNDLVGDFRPTYTHTANLAFERQLSPTWAISTSYVGKFSRHGYYGAERNPAVYGPGATTKNTDARRIYAPLYGSMVGTTSDARGSYNAWQTMLTKRLSHGLSIQAHYTLSRAMDQCSTEVIGSCNPQNPFNPGAEWALGDYDRTHVTVVTFIYELPKMESAPRFLSQAIGGWQIASYQVFQSGNPFTVVTGKDASLTGVGNDRPNQIADPNISGDRSQAEWLAQYFNPAAFVTNGPGQYGNTGRNSLRGPFDRRWDMSLKKVFYPYGERTRLELRCDVNNILDHTVYDAPGSSLASLKSFGVISSTVVSGRVVRLGLHLDF